MENIHLVIQELAAKYRELPSNLGYGPATEDQIQSAEKELGVSFPTSFRDYLSHYAGGLLFGYEICGIPTEKSRIPTFPEDSPATAPVYSILDLVTCNKKFANRMPKGHIYIASDGVDFAFFLDTSEMIEKECPVVMYGPGANRVKVARDFLDFIRQIAIGTSFNNSK